LAHPTFASDDANKLPDSGQQVKGFSRYREAFSAHYLHSFLSSFCPRFFVRFFFLQDCANYFLRLAQ
jgi:hypothetical protein